MPPRRRSGKSKPEPPPLEAEEPLLSQEDPPLNSIETFKDADPVIEIQDDPKPIAAHKSDDPIIREYDVYLTDSISQGLILLQYPNRDRQQPYSESLHAKPSELRTKPGSGFVEVDIPMNIYDNYDRVKAVKWGDALKKSIATKSGGSHGLAAGFGIGAATGGAQRVARASRAQDVEMDDFDNNEQRLLAHYAESNAKGQVLNKQTLGGQIIPAEDIQPIYLVGVFRENQLHLTRMDNIVQLRPQFHHIDAMVEQEKSSARLQRDMPEPARHQEPRAVEMTAKTADDEDMDMTLTAKVLKAAQEERWKRLDYLDEDSQGAWDSYENLFLKEPGAVSNLRPMMVHDEFLNAISMPTLEVTAATKRTATKKKTHAPGKASQTKHDEDISDSENGTDQEMTDIP